MDSEDARRSVRALLWRLTWGICAVTVGSILLAILILVSTVWFAGASLTGYAFSLVLFSIAALWGASGIISLWGTWLHSDGEAADRLALYVEIAYLGGVPLAVLIIVASSSGGWVFVAPIAAAVTAPVLVTAVKWRVRPLRLIRDPYLQLVRAAAERRSAAAGRTLTDLQAPLGPLSVREWTLRQRR
ncbi:hypothetical protein C1N91_12730 [Curtobacterium sp. SGAir0471]|nr:hypothetical protein C1N91_12730 [Curtobacterium sp. SGAir0471]